MFKIVLTELAESLWWPDHWEHFRSGPRTVDSGQWTVDSGHWTVDTGHWNRRQECWNHKECEVREHRLCGVWGVGLDT